MKSIIRIRRNKHNASAIPCGAEFLLVAQVLFVCTAVEAEEIRFQTQSYCAVLGTDAVWQSLAEPTTDRSLLATDRKTPFAYLQLDGKIFSANSAQRAGDRLIVGFDSLETQLEFAIEQAEHWVTFRIERITGPRPQRITFLRIGVDLTAHVGVRLNGAWDEQTAVVVRGTNRQTLGRPISRAGSTLDEATSPHDTLHKGTRSLVHYRHVKIVLRCFLKRLGVRCLLNCTRYPPESALDLLTEGDA